MTSLFPPSSSVLPLCKYGANCYQKNAQHRQAYRHEEKQNNALKKRKSKETENSEGEEGEREGEGKKSPKKTVNSLPSSSPLSSPSSLSPPFPPIDVDDSQSDDEWSSNSQLNFSNFPKISSSPSGDLSEQWGEILMKIYSLKFPSDFFDFFQLAVDWKKESQGNASNSPSLHPLSLFEIPSSTSPPSDFRLVGPFDFLTGHFTETFESLGNADSQGKSKFSPHLHFRYFWDFPEFQTVFSVVPSDPSASLPSVSPPPHVGFWRDSPDALPSLIGRMSGESPIVKPMGGNLFLGILNFVDEVIEAEEKSKKNQKNNGGEAEGKNSKNLKTPQEFRNFLLKHPLTAKYNVLSKGVKISPSKDSLFVSRKRLVVCPMIHGLGLVVPYVNDVGWREMHCTLEELTKMVRRMESEHTRGVSVSYDQLDRFVHLMSLAVDESDPGCVSQFWGNVYGMTNIKGFLEVDAAKAMKMAYQFEGYHLWAQIIVKQTKYRRRKDVDQITRIIRQSKTGKNHQ